MTTTTHLDVPGTVHPGVMVAPPRLNLRRTGSYNLHDKGPPSSTSSAFSFNHLIFSPPPSPGLPALVPRPRQSPTAPRPSRVIRLVFWTLGLLLIAYAGISIVRHGPSPTLQPRKEYRPQEDSAMVGQDEVPGFPTPVLLTTERGSKPQWTVSVPEKHQFPMSMKHYGAMCAMCREISARAGHSHPSVQPAGRGGRQQGLASARTDTHFVDVLDAQKSGLLPGHQGVGPNVDAVWKAGDLVGLPGNTMAKPVCEQTMTFVLESTDAGLGTSMMLLWSFYGLARQQGRAFFIDDSRWAYDRYLSLFQAPPIPSCRPPSRQEMIPCPAQARHLVVSAATAPDVFPELASGGQLPGEPKAAYDARIQDAFGLARAGYEALFRVSQDDGDYVRTRVRELREKALKARKVVVGAHVRHGDKHPLEPQYAGSYIPTHVFSEKASTMLEIKTASGVAARKDGDGGGDGAIDAQRRSLMVVASDDPVVYESGEFVGSVRAQERVRLASKTLIQKMSPGGGAMHKFVDETFGWEGGFFAAMFWNLGNPVNAAEPALLGKGEASAQADERPAASPDTLRLRSLVGRAYVMDLAVVAGVSDVVVCTASATGCRLLAVMMGWESAMSRGNWANVDGDLGWSSFVERGQLVNNHVMWSERM